MKIQPSVLAYAQTDRNGDLVTIDEDVLDIARQLREIDPCLSVIFNERRGLFVVVETLEDGSETLVTTAEVLDQRLIERIRKISHSDYSYTAELDRIDKERTKAIDHRFREAVGEAGERLKSVLKPKGSSIVVPHRGHR